MLKLSELKQELRKYATKERAKSNRWYFKTGKGEYGEGDQFIGVTMPDLRKAVKEFRELPVEDTKKLLFSKIHEERLASLLIFVYQFEKGDENEKKEIYNFYIKNAKNVNNWDLVDSSAGYIVGQYLLDKRKDILYKFARSKNLWKKRIAVISTFAFIRADEFEDAFEIAEILLNDKHDLIHKAVGWMLREVGNRSIKEEEIFLKKHYAIMPRTMLRYAIEKFPEDKRKAYLKGVI